MRSLTFPAILGILALGVASAAEAVVLFSTAPPNSALTGAVLRNGGIPVNVEIADDFEVAESSIVDEVVFWTIGTIPVTSFVYGIWSDVVGKPGNVLESAVISNAVTAPGVGDQTKWTAKIDPYTLFPGIKYWLTLYMPSSAVGVYGWQYTGGPGFGGVAVGGERPGSGFPVSFPRSVAFELRGVVGVVMVPPPVALLISGFIGLLALRAVRRRHARRAQST
jgi:hypothetical protein